MNHCSSEIIIKIVVSYSKKQYGIYYFCNKKKKVNDMGFKRNNLNSRLIKNLWTLNNNNSFKQR